MLKIKDTITSNKNNIDDQPVINIYLCGPTVYDSVHIGNMRPIITTDIIIRLLEYTGKKVNYIQNITDVDDKIVNKATEENVDFIELANKYKKEFTALLNTINIRYPSSTPTVIDNVKMIETFIQKLIDSGDAYETNGNVYFNLEDRADYGVISKRKIEDLILGDTNDSKKNKRDFALWKSFEDNNFNSQWSQGRPGWHTECAAFINEATKGKGVDLHIGGTDLKFPHHENERIQFNAITGNEISKNWMHIGQLNVNGKKMSKSLNNFIYAKDFINENSIESLKVLLLATHYSKPINLTEDYISYANKLTSKIKNLDKKIKLNNDSNIEPYNGELLKEFINELDNDLNTGNALTVMQKAMKEINKDINNIKIISEFYTMLDMMGLGELHA